MKNIMVVGGAGYIGSVICKYLLNAGYKVTVFDRFMYGDSALKELQDCAIVRGDTRDISQLHATMKRCDAIVYLAELVGDAICREHATEAFETNELAAISAVRMARRLNRQFIYFSSCSVYGASENPDEMLDESSPLIPQSEYAKYKIKVEGEILSNALPRMCIFRLGTVFGLSPRLRFDLVINLFAAKAFFDKKLEIYGGMQWRPHTHVCDVAKAVLLALEAPEEALCRHVFNVVTANLRIIELGYVITDLFSEVEMERKNEQADPRNYRVSGKRANECLKFNPHRTVASGILEFKRAFESGEISNYTDPRYSNVDWYRGDGHG